MLGDQEFQLRPSFQLALDSLNQLLPEEKRFSVETIKSMKNPQSEICAVLDSLTFDLLLDNSSTKDKARLRSVVAPKAGAFLEAVPIESIGLKMAPIDFSVAVRLIRTTNL